MGFTVAVVDGICTDILEVLHVQPTMHGEEMFANAKIGGYVKSVRFHGILPINSLRPYLQFKSKRL